MGLLSLSHSLARALLAVSVIASLATAQGANVVNFPGSGVPRLNNGWTLDVTSQVNNPQPPTPLPPNNGLSVNEDGGVRSRNVQLIVDPAEIKGFGEAAEAAGAFGSCTLDYQDVDFVTYVFKFDSDGGTYCEPKAGGSCMIVGSVEAKISGNHGFPTWAAASAVCAAAQRVTVSTAAGQATAQDAQVVAQASSTSTAIGGTVTIGIIGLNISATVSTGWSPGIKTKAMGDSAQLNAAPLTTGSSSASVSVRSEASVELMADSDPAAGGVVRARGTCNSKASADLTLTARIQCVGADEERKIIIERYSGAGN